MSSLTKVLALAGLTAASNNNYLGGGDDWKGQCRVGREQSPVNFLKKDEFHRGFLKSTLTGFYYELEVENLTKDGTYEWSKAGDKVEKHLRTRAVDMKLKVNEEDVKEGAKIIENGNKMRVLGKNPSTFASEEAKYKLLQFKTKWAEADVKKATTVNAKKEKQTKADEALKAQKAQLDTMKEEMVFKGNLSAVTPGPDFSSVKSEWEVDGSSSEMGMTFRQPSEHQILGAEFPLELQIIFKPKSPEVKDEVEAEFENEAAYKAAKDKKDIIVGKASGQKVKTDAAASEIKKGQDERNFKVPNPEKQTGDRNNRQNRAAISILFTEVRDCNTVKMTAERKAKREAKSAKKKMDEMNDSEREELIARNRQTDINKAGQAKASAYISWWEAQEAQAKKIVALKELYVKCEGEAKPAACFKKRVVEDPKPPTDETEYAKCERLRAKKCKNTNDFFASLHNTKLRSAQGTVTLPLHNMLQEVQEEYFYQYDGSLTEPPCTEGVKWMVYSKPLPICSEHLSMFKEKYGSNENFAGKIRGNNRRVQNMNDRKFYFNTAAGQSFSGALTNLATASFAAITSVTLALM